MSLLHTQGYEIESAAYESGRDKDGEEGGPLHIDLVNPITDDRITLVVDADSSDNVTASLHQFGTADSSFPDEDKQRHLMEPYRKRYPERDRSVGVRKMQYAAQEFSGA